MKTLTGCIKDIGAQGLVLSAENNRAVKERASKFRKAGKDALEAAKLAVDEQIAAVQAMLSGDQPQTPQAPANITAATPAVAPPPKTTLKELVKRRMSSDPVSELQERLTALKFIRGCIEK